MFLLNQFYSQQSVFISHQSLRDSEVFIKFSNHAQKPYFFTFTIVGDGK